MSDQLDTIWEAEPHTIAKHKILTSYLQAWAPIMSRHLEKVGKTGQKLLFVDGFAGPGRYSNGYYGSPVLTVNAILDHTVQLPVPVHLFFIEENQSRYEILDKTVGNLRDEIDKSDKIEKVCVKHGTCEDIINPWLDKYDEQGKKLGPAFFFLDQFGYSDVSMDMIKRILRHQYCEVFTYLNWANLNRFISDKTKSAAITRTFGSNKWRQVLKLELKQRASFMLNLYKDALSQKAGAKYVWHFGMGDKNDKLIYWLFFCTNSLRGLEEMKKAMWKVDSSGGFRFSDKDNPTQLHLFGDYNDPSLAEDLANRLRGKTLSIAEVEEFVLTETPAYKYKTALISLEKEKRLSRVDANDKKPKRGFPDMKMKIRFENQQSFFH